MHDIRAIRETPELYETAWAAKGRSGAAAQAVDLDAKLRAAKLALETAQSRRNEASKLIGQAKARKDEAEATREALQWARPGDLLVLPIHEPARRDVVVALLDHLRDAGWRAGQRLPED